MNVLGRWARFLISRYHYLLAASHRHFGNKYGSMEEYDHAVDAFTRAIVYDPSFARAYLDRGILYWRELAHPCRAVLDLTRAYELDDHLAEAVFNRGIAHQEVREYAEAIADYQVYLDTGDHPYWREYAETMIRELTEWMPGSEDEKT